MDTRSLYETDTYTWALEQAAALRRAGVSVTSNTVDWANVAEEIESLGNEQAHAVESHLAVAIRHLLKLEHSPASLPRNRWMAEVDDARTQIDRRMKKNPGLRPHLSDLLADARTSARRLALSEIAREDRQRADIPETCPFTPGQVREIGWFPAWLHETHDTTTHDTEAGG